MRQYNSKEHAPHYGSILALNAQAANATEEKIRISPVGEVKGADGRSYRVDAQSVIRRTQELKVDIVLNVNHGWDTYGGKAAGWFDLSSLEEREDGIYASLSATSIGTELITERHFRYLSPEYIVARDSNGTMEVLTLAGVGLVNKPNLLDEALNKTENKETQMPNKETPDTSATEQITALQQENERLQKELQTNKIEAAITAGQLMPAKKEFALQLNGQMLVDYLTAEAESMKQLGEQLAPEKTEEHNSISPEEAAVAAQLGMTEEER